MNDAVESTTDSPRGLNRKHLVAAIPIVVLAIWFGYLWFVSGVIPSITKYPDGSMKEKGYATRVGMMTYRRSGTWVTYHPNGATAGEGKYEDGEKVPGSWTYWDEKGNVIGSAGATTSSSSTE